MNAEVRDLIESLRDRISREPELCHRDLISLVSPSIRLGTRRVHDDELEIGASRIGGTPDVPPGFEWPHWMPSKRRDDKYGQPWVPDGPAPLGFIAQIDLSSTPQVDAALPSTGWLYFFYDRFCEPWGFDPEDRGCCRVAYVDCHRSQLTRAKSPADLDEEHVAYPSAVAAKVELTLPEYLPDLEYGTAEYEAYRGIVDELIAAQGVMHHRLLGHAQPVQNPMELECQLASNGVYCGGASHFQEAQAKALEPGAVDWRLFLQIDTDDDGPGWMWGDVGRIYYWIKKQDLTTRRFDDVWLIFQCS